MPFENSAGVRNVPASSHNATSFSKLLAADNMFFSSSFLVPANIFSKTGTMAGSRCLLSPALQSMVAFPSQGFSAFVNMLSLRFVSMCSKPWDLYSCWISSKMTPILLDGLSLQTFPGPSYKHRYCNIPPMTWP